MTSSSSGALDPQPRGATERRPGELGPRELARWSWRQLTSMRTALILLLLLALAAIPGSVIPQSGVDALNVTRWKAEHPQLTPIYERLGMFSVYSSPWFSAIYILLMVSLVGCIVPRMFVYARNARAVPPAAPRNLARLPVHAAVELGADESPEAALGRARAALRSRRYRLRPAADGDDFVSAERGYLREVGNLLFHVSVLVVLVGFAIGALFGYQGGVIVLSGSSFSNTVTSYDDLAPGSLFAADDLDPFQFRVDDFDAQWIQSGPGKGTARGFQADLSYTDAPGDDEQSYALRVNHPLTIDGTDVFLIGHGYAPRLTVRDGEGNIAASGPRVFLPQDQSLLSFGVVKASSARPEQIGLEGLFYPFFQLDANGDPVTVSGEALNPLVSMTVFEGDLGLADGPQSVYVLDKDRATQLTKADGQPYRIDLRVGDTVTLPDGLGTVTFEGVDDWVKVQISQTPGKRIALAGVVLALIGLLGSLFVRSRRVWVRVRRDGGVTMVEVAVLDRSGGSDLSDVLDDIVGALRKSPADAPSGTPAQETT